MDDSQAISAVLQGDKNRYEELVGKYRRMVYAIAWSHLGDTDLSEDVAQETFVKAYCYLGTLREPGKFSPWLARIARNVCNSFRRRARREDAFKQRWARLEAAEPQGPEESRGSLEEQMWSSFAQLSEIHREALTVFYIEGKSSEDMATVLGITESTARVRLSRARVALREQLAQKLEDTLDDLQPSERFTRSVMVLLPLSPKGAALGAGGGALAGLGKISASLSFALWFTFAPLIVLPAAHKLEIGNIIDTPENKWRKALVRRTWKANLRTGSVLGAIWGVIVISVYMMDPMGGQEWMRACFKLLVLTSLPALYEWFRLLQVNRSGYVVAKSIACVLGEGMWVGLGFFHAPMWTLFATLLLLLALEFIYRDSHPNRNDYSIFLRCATGGVADTSGEESEPLRTTDLYLKSFARFLGEQWIVVGYSWQRNGIVLLLPRVPPDSLFLGMHGGSRIAIPRVGGCTARLSGGDMKAISKISASQVTKEELESKACRAVTGALRKFVDGDLAEARSILTPQSKEAIFRKPVVRTAYWWLLFVYSVVFAILSMLSWTHHVR